MMVVFITTIIFFQYHKQQSIAEEFKKIELLNVRVDLGERKGELSTGVFGTVLNRSANTIKLLEMTVAFLGNQEEVLAEKKYFPIFPSFENPGFLLPGKTRDFGFDLTRYAPENWSGKVITLLTKVEFR